MSEKRLHILEVAEQLFYEKGFEGTSVRDIANTASVNLAMISYYFGSKEKLLTALVEWRAGYIQGVLNELVTDETLDPFEKIDRLVNLYTDKIFNHSRFHCIMTTHLPTIQSEKIKQLMTDIKLRNLDNIRRIITEGQKKGFFRKVDIELTVASIMGTITHITSSKPLYYKIYGIERNNAEAYNKKIAPKLKTHLKQLLRTHLDIKSDTGIS